MWQRGGRTSSRSRSTSSGPNRSRRRRPLRSRWKSQRNEDRRKKSQKLPSRRKSRGLIACTQGSSTEEAASCRDQGIDSDSWTARPRNEEASTYLSARPPVLRFFNQRMGRFPAESRPPAGRSERLLYPEIGRASGRERV